MKNKSFYTQLNKEQRYILNCCFFVFAINGIYAMSLGSLLPLISAEYGLKDTVSGALLSAHQVGNLISGFIAGILPLYLGRKKSIMFLCSFVVMGFSIMILTGNPILLILGFLFTGLSRGSISNFNNSVVNELSDSSPVALNILHSIFAVGALISPFLVILCTYISNEQGWKIAAGVIVFLCLISIFLFSRMKIDNAEKEAKKVKVSYGFLKNADFLISCGILFFYFFFSFYNLLPLNIFSIIFLHLVKQGTGNEMAAFYLFQFYIAFSADILCFRASCRKSAAGLRIYRTCYFTLNDTFHFFAAVQAGNRDCIKQGTGIWVHWISEQLLIVCPFNALSQVHNRYFIAYMLYYT